MTEREKRLFWKTTNKRAVEDYKLFELYKMSRECGEKKGDFVVLDAPNWVTVIPLLEPPEGGVTQDSFILVEQFRHGIGELCLEFPAGLIEPNEPPEEAAKRELLEETGYLAKEITLIGEVNPNPAFMTNRSFTFLASGLSKTTEQELDPNEVIDVHVTSVEELDRKVETRPFQNAIMVQAYYWFLRYQERSRKRE